MTYAEQQTIDFIRQAVILSIEHGKPEIVKEFCSLTLNGKPIMELIGFKHCENCGELRECTSESFDTLDPETGGDGSLTLCPDCWSRFDVESGRALSRFYRAKKGGTSEAH